MNHPCAQEHPLLLAELPVEVLAAWRHDCIPASEVEAYSLLLLALDGRRLVAAAAASRARLAVPICPQTLTTPAVSLCRRTGCAGLPVGRCLCP